MLTYKGKELKPIRWLVKEGSSGYVENDRGRVREFTEEEAKRFVEERNVPGGTRYKAVPVK